MDSRNRQLVGLVIADPPSAWKAAGFTIVDDAVVLSGVRLHLVDDADASGIAAWDIDGLANDVDGLSCRSVQPAGSQRAEGANDLGHPNGVTGIDHLVVATPNLPRTIAALNKAGFDERRTRTFEIAGVQRQQTFFWAGSVIIELIGEVGEQGSGPAAFWGLAFTADDLDGTAEFLGDLVSPPKAAVQRGRRIATLRTGDLGISLPVAIMTPHVAKRAE